MGFETKKAYCRLCTASCAIDVDVEDGRVVAVRGTKADPLSGGYTCMKGRDLPDSVHADGRLRTALKRRADGSFEEIPTSQALDEIAKRLTAIREKYGPRAIASFCGTAAYSNSATIAVVKAWHRAVGSINNFSTMTVDQPAKVVVPGRVGAWGGGWHTFASADVVMSIGNNPIVSGLTLPGGPPGWNPSHTVREAIKGGLKLIVVDPRKTQLAKLAHLHLQIRPGEDPTLLAGMIRIVLAENLHDEKFCAQHVGGLELLKRHVEPFTPEYVADRVGISTEELLEAARLFARGPRGCVSSGTGPDMAPHSCLTEHLITSLNSICGRWNREGDRVPNPGVLQPDWPRLAQAIPPDMLPELFQLGEGPKSRVRDLQRVCDEMPSCTLAEEILTPGEGQIRALITVGGNPAVALPDQNRTLRALDDLELSVCVDIAMTPTARRADYVLPAKHHLEREDVTEFMDMFFEVPYAFYTQPVVEAGAEVLDDWEVFAGLAARMGDTIELDGGVIEGMPSKFEVLELIRPDTRIPMERVRDEAAEGKIFDELELFVDPPMEDLDARLELSPPGIGEELSEVRKEPTWSEVNEGRPQPFTHQMICSRLRNVANSVGQTQPNLRQDANRARLHPADLSALGIEDGERIRIANEQGSIEAIASGSEDIRSGVVSIAHCWGQDDGDAGDVATRGVNTNRLLRCDLEFDAITGQPRMSAVPVTICPA